jgi:hypothetical protein
MFNALNMSKEWSILQKYCTEACFNWGNHDHGAPKCPKLINQARFDKDKAKFSRNGGGQGGQSSCYNGGHRQDPGHGDGGKSFTRCKWKGHGKATSVLSTVGGTGKHKGMWSMTCKTCG